ncbi:unnamed protein product [Linum tenue]|uniref:Uncharacterized protein n=1 Tax=Linum tenue TaxID=586396 RepID=A0AAV0IXZ6_9ROSI|nr:unnamed protein product [Linum tenue]
MESLSYFLLMSCNIGRTINFDFLTSLKWQRMYFLFQLHKLQSLLLVWEEEY